LSLLLLTYLPISNFIGLVLAQRVSGPSLEVITGTAL